MGKGLKVVLAEDNRLQRVILSRMLVSLGYEVLLAEDGQQALDIIQRESDAHIVLTDYQMPKLNGIELTQMIRDLGLDHYIHVIMITGRDEDDLRAEAFEAGVDDFLAKGQSPVALKARMRSAARLVEHAAALSESSRSLRETHARLEDDLRSAANAQRQLLPDIHREVLGFRISSTFVPSAIVSGDMFGCFELTDTKLGFYAVDVSGHGVHASLLSVAIGHLITPEFFRNRVLVNADRPDPAALVDDLNRRFSASENDDYFTMFCGVIDKWSGRLDFCQAAYPFPQLVSPTGEAVSVGDGGFPVGMLPQAEYENGVVDFVPGQSLVIYSDAVTEAENDQQVAFGLDRVRALLAGMPGASAEDMPSELVSALTEWRGGQPLEDDLTIVVLERTT